MLKNSKHNIKVCISTMHINENLIVSSAYMNVWCNLYTYMDVYISDNKFGKNNGVLNLQYAGDLY